ncbi:MAG: HlyD family efflux transporter periplasmic adaptor subunit [Dysgonamonadaceae bacterium]|jgi:HlyD family secretion protein|nr:HlyD family efflux transporter periplasmic adaptor subunit [Dysgonamonadaceae bacterium]
MKHLFVITCLSLSALFSGCGKNRDNQDASGMFETTEVLVSSQAAGQLMRLDVEEGQSLRANARAGYVDTIQLYLKKKQLLANLRAIDSRSHNVSLQMAALRQQIAQQQQELTRFQNLLRSNAATQKQVDDIQANIYLLQKQLDAQIESLEKNNRSVSGESEALLVQIEQVTDLINKCLIVSPVSGVVLAKYAEAGEITAQGKALFKVGDLDNLFLRAYITADQLTQLKMGQTVSISIDFGKKDRKEYAGKVTWISEKAEFTPKTVQTRNERANSVYAVKIAVKNDGYIKIGMYGEVRL